MPNRLAGATSPYLLQHQDNPVDWWPWGEEAFAEARRRDLPILLSVGYAACHWCHVMAHESFEDPRIARAMNEQFVCVKVDREERPDVDAIYLSAVQAMTGQGGWPMTVILTPTGEPFFAGTYFPPRPAHGLPSFPQVLEAIGQAWRDQREDVLRSSRQIAERLSTGPATGRAELSADRLDAAVEVLAGEYDATYGGFGGAPKFPPPMVLEFLLRQHARTGAEHSLAMVVETAERMARGGMYDQLAGGFARYSVDARWVVPHFEKMLYDNALLLRCYAHVWRDTGSPLAERVVRETAGFLLGELRTEQGGFAASLDADSEGEEGRFAVWTRAELVDVLGPDDGRWAAELFVVSVTGSFEGGRSVLQLPVDPDDPQRYAEVRARLAAARADRPRPARDEKVVAAWNGLAIAALAEAGALLAIPEWVDAAEGAAALLAEVHLVDGRLRRTSRDGRVGTPAGVLEDYADLAEGLLALASVRGSSRWLSLAGELLDVVLDRFRDGDGGCFDTADDAERLLHRPRELTDGATPSGSSAAAGALLGFAAFTGSARHRDAGEEILAAVAPLLPRFARAAGWVAAVGEAALGGPAEIAIVGSPDDPTTAALERAGRRSASPGAVVAVGPPDAPPWAPLLEGRTEVDGRAAAYVCRHFTCARPTTDPDELRASLDGPRISV